jgi:acylphosphatase
MTRVRLVVSGNVQGVGFRFTARAHAQILGLKGLVRNTKDGTVEIICEGEDENINEFCLWCSDGPESAEVTTVQRIEEQPTGEFHDFAILQ